MATGNILSITQDGTFGSVDANTDKCEIATADLTAPSGTPTKMWITLGQRAGASENTTFAKVYIGHKAGAGDAWDAASLTQVLFGGSAAVTIAPGGSSRSDEIAFAWNKTSALILSMYFNVAAADILSARVTGSSNNHQKTAVDEASLANATGYTTFAGYLTGVIKIETDGFPFAGILTAAVGTFTLAGIAAALNKGKTLTAEVGAFILTGIAANWLRVYNLAAAVGTFMFTGVAAGLTKAWLPLAAAAGAFVLTGFATLKQISMVAVTGAFSLTGIASLQKITKIAAVGTFVFTGVAATLRKGLILGAAAGSFAFTGVATILHYGRVNLQYTKRRWRAFRLNKFRVNEPKLDD